ncbi:hypothetical protein FACS1894125_1290 [Actinomycetota bacterium]|nr:hypothetical protein FACS1894125_1290 [Actinomycetota bacterium]
MIVRKVAAEQLEKIGKIPSIIFDAVEFNELNKDKVDRVDYLLLGKGESNRFSLCLGVTRSVAKIPFSAPFALPEVCKSGLGILNYDEMLTALDVYASENGIEVIKFVLPPIFYSEEVITALVNAFFRHGYINTIVDVNYAFKLCDVFKPEYPSAIQKNARKNLQTALRSDLVLRKCATDEEIKVAYDVIAENRSSKGYPLRMSYEQIKQTINVVTADVFMVLKDEQAVAAAFVFHISEKIVQVVYWGDTPGFENFRPINFLAYKLIEFYGKSGMDFLDIGPSTEGSMPNFGLCDFKESIGCTRSLKFSFEKNIQLRGGGGQFP